jgi:hypothetical protein
MEPMRLAKPRHFQHVLRPPVRRCWVSLVAADIWLRSGQSWVDLASDSTATHLGKVREEPYAQNFKPFIHTFFG